MRSKFRKDFLWVNEQREKRGFAPLSRREFMRLAAMSSAGASLSMVYACGGDDDGAAGATGTGAMGGFTPPTGGAPGGTGGLPPGTGGATAGAGGGAPAAGTGGTPAGAGGTPAGAGGGPAGAGGQPAGAGGATAGGTPAGSGGTPGGTGGEAAGTGGGPAGSGGEPGLDGGTPSGLTKVAVTRHADIITNVRDAIELAGGLGDIQQGDRVVIKPNLVTSFWDTYTHPDVLRAIIQACKDRTPANNITLAECTAIGMSTRMWAEMAGYVALCQEEGINEFACWDELPYVGYQDPKWEFITEEKRVPQMLDPANPQYEHFITAPKLKNHTLCPYSSAVFTSCIKLFVGVIPFEAPGGRWTPEPDGIHDEYLGEQVAELHCIVPNKVMNVIDATTCVPANGPTGTGADPIFTRADTTGPMVIANAGLIIASNDIAACDSMGLAVLKHYAKELRATTNPELASNPGVNRYVDRSVWEDAQVRRAGELGIGVADPGQIEVLNEGVDNIQAILAEWV